MFGERIREVRKRMKLSQAEFAKNLGISRAHVSKLEIGQAVPSRQLLNLISEMHSIRVEWLVDGIGPMETDIDKTGRLVQKIACDSLHKHLELFLILNREITDHLIEALQDRARDIVPEFCPPELLDQLRQVLNIPRDDLRVLVRDTLAAWQSVGKDSGDP